MKALRHKTLNKWGYIEQDGIYNRLEESDEPTIFSDDVVMSSDELQEGFDMGLTEVFMFHNSLEKNITNKKELKNYNLVNVEIIITK